MQPMYPGLGRAALVDSMLGPATDDPCFNDLKWLTVNPNVVI